MKCCLHMHDKVSSVTEIQMKSTKQGGTQLTALEREVQEDPRSSLASEPK